MISERYIDKRSWPRGAWDNEPDLLYWEVELPCFVQRHEFFGVLLGYAGIPGCHPWFGKGWQDLGWIAVHGGVTFGGRIELEQVPTTRDLWWVGFDCGHGFDYQPGLIGYMNQAGVGDDAARLYCNEAPSRFSIVYRDLNYVRGELARLVEQVLAAARGDQHVH